MERADNNIRELSVSVTVPVVSNGKRPAPFLNDALFQSECDWNEDTRLAGNNDSSYYDSYRKRQCHGVSMVTQEPSIELYKGAQVKYDLHRQPSLAAICARCLAGEPGHISHMMIK